MALMRLQMTIDSTVYPDLHDLLLPLGGVGRAEKLRYLATVALLLQRQSSTPALLPQPVVATDVSGLPATATGSVEAGVEQAAAAADAGVTVILSSLHEAPTEASETSPAATASATAVTPPKAPSRASSLARRMSSDLLGGRATT